MYVTVIVAFLTKLSEFGSLEFEICIEVWFWLNGKRKPITKMPSMKGDGAKLKTEKTENSKLNHTKKLV